jgi:hypothetical protein
MKSQRLLGIVIVLQSLTLLGLWVGIPSTQPASAQVPDGGQQRLAQLKELEAINAKLDKLITILADGKLQVQVATPDEKK